MRTHALLTVLCAILLAGCSSDGAKLDRKTKELVRVKAILTGLDGQSLSVRDVEVEHYDYTPNQPRRDELVFSFAEGSNDIVVYPLEKIESVELSKTRPDAGSQIPVEVTLRGGKTLSLLLFDFKLLNAQTLEEGAPISRTASTLSRLDVLQGAD